MSTVKNLVDSSYWENYWASNLDDITHNNLKVEYDDAIYLWLKSFLGKQEIKGQTCIEIGCFPGRYLTFFGSLNYQLNGIDFIKNVFQISEELKKMGYDVGEFWQEEFLSFASSTQNKFDLVSSFGFIEHFTNWEEVLNLHMKLVKKGGYLIIEAPNFGGWPHRIIRYLFDQKNFQKHYIPAISYKKWRAAVLKQNFKIIFCGGFGGFHYGLENKSKNLFFKQTLKLLDYILRKLNASKYFASDSFDSYYGLIAKRDEA